jgi:transposase
MERYVGLDVSLKQTSICVVNQAGSIIQEGVVDSDPEAIAAFVRSKAPGTVRIGLETGPTTTWLWTELKRLGLPVICIDARHAKAVLKMQINKSDRNDAAGIARIMQTGWFKEVRVKDLDSHSVKALLASRALLVKIKRDLENQVRGLLKNLGLVIGRAKFNVFAVRTEALIEDHPELVAAVRPLLEARKAMEQQIDDLDCKVLKLARHDIYLPPAHTMLTPLEIEAPPFPLAEFISAQTSSANARHHGVKHAGRRSLSTYACGIRSRSASLSNENRGHSCENKQHAPQGSI